MNKQTPQLVSHLVMKRLSYIVTPVCVRESKNHPLTTSAFQVSASVKT